LLNLTKYGGVVLYEHTANNLIDLNFDRCFSVADISSEVQQAMLRTVFEFNCRELKCESSKFKVKQIKTLQKTHFHAMTKGIKAGKSARNADSDADVILSVYQSQVQEMT
ncbi:hypothetical protein P5673_033716, partial [Acropora cervicornis]